MRDFQEAVVLSPRDVVLDPLAMRAFLDRLNKPASLVDLVQAAARAASVAILADGLSESERESLADIASGLWGDARRVRTGQPHREIATLDPEDIANLYSGVILMPVCDRLREALARVREVLTVPPVASRAVDDLLSVRGCQPSQR